MKRLLLGVFLAASAAAWAAESPANAKCPVLTEEDVDPALWTEYQGKKVFFCCQDCKRQFIERPEAFLKNLPQFSKSALPAAAKTEAHEHAEDEDHAQHAEAAHGEHDHSKDHGELAPRSRLIVLLGKLHPAVVHFPIALILAASLAELLHWRWPRRQFADAARFMVMLGAFSGIVTVLSGWMAALDARYPANLLIVLERHRWLGVSTAAVAVLAAALALLAERRPLSVRYVWGYRAALLVAAVLVSLTGFYGGTLVFGPEHFSW